MTASDAYFTGDETWGVIDADALAAYLAGVRQGNTLTVDSRIALAALQNSYATLASLDALLIGDRNTAAAAAQVAQGQYNYAALLRNDDALADLAATIAAQQLEISRANLRRHALDGQFAIVAANWPMFRPNGSAGGFSRQPI